MAYSLYGYNYTTVEDSTWTRYFRDGVKVKYYQGNVEYANYTSGFTYAENSGVYGNTPAKPQKVHFKVSNVSAVRLYTSTWINRAEVINVFVNGVLHHTCNGYTSGGPYSFYLTDEIIGLDESKTYDISYVVSYTSVQRYLIFICIDLKSSTTPVFSTSDYKQGTAVSVSAAETGWTRLENDSTSLSLSGCTSYASGAMSGDKYSIVAAGGMVGLQITGVTGIRFIGQYYSYENGFYVYKNGIKIDFIDGCGSALYPAINYEDLTLDPSAKYTFTFEGYESGTNIFDAIEYKTADGYTSSVVPYVQIKNYTTGTRYDKAGAGYTRFSPCHPGVNIMGYNMIRFESTAHPISAYYKTTTGPAYEICRPGYGSLKFKVTGAVNVYPLCFTYSDKSTDIKVYINGELKQSVSQTVAASGINCVAFCLIEGLDPTETYTIELKTLASNTGNWNIQAIDMCGGVVDDVSYTPTIISRDGATTALGSFNYLTVDPGWTRFDSSDLNMYSYSGSYGVTVNTNTPTYYKSSYKQCRDGCVSVIFTGASAIRYCGAEYTNTVTDLAVYLNGDQVSVVNLNSNSTNCGSTAYRASVLHEIVDLDPTKTYIVTYQSTNTSGSYLVPLDSIDLYGDTPQLAAFTPTSIFLGTPDGKLCQYDASSASKLKNIMDYTLTNLQASLFDYDNSSAYAMVTELLKLADDVRPTINSLVGGVTIEMSISSSISDTLLDDNSGAIINGKKSVAYGTNTSIVQGDVAYGTGVKQEFIIPTQSGVKIELKETPETVANNVNILARPPLIYSDNIGYSEMQINVTPKNDGIHMVATDYCEIYTIYTKDSPFFAPEVGTSEDGSPMRRINVNLNNFFEIVFKEPYDTIVTPDWMTVMDSNKRVNGMPTISGTYYLICTKDGIPTKLEIVVNALTRMA